MDLIQVDPKLFITCRLCVEEMGQYQIVPSVQQKIKYCFDIDVESFDGLPQLICDKCNKILTNVAQWKQSFTEKQLNLKTRTKKPDKLNSIQTLCSELDRFPASSSLQPQQDTVSSSQQIFENNEAINKYKRNRLSKCSSTGEDDSEKSYASIQKARKKKSIADASWKRDYVKKYVCKVCNSDWTNKKYLLRHYRIHTNLGYKSVLENECFIKLTKIDDKPNLTGQNNTVVFSKNRIIEEGNKCYYTIYLKEPDETEISSQKIISKSTRLSSSDDEIIVKPKIISKKRRLMSRSSNETVVIETEGVNNDSDDEGNSKYNGKQSIKNDTNDNDRCINIDDSSGSEHDSNDNNLRQSNEASFNDYKIIQGVISMCVKTYENKNEFSEFDAHAKKTDKSQSSTESQLKHKIMSIGRKVITQQGFNCTGLLRYMEYKNLEIVWVRKQAPFGTKESNYIRILTKLRDNKDVSYNKWLKVLDIPPCKDIPMEEQSEVSSKIVEQQEDSAIIYSNPTSSEAKNKLLNENPVANPKQLPKKLCLKNKDDFLCMPIITSTTSLAVIPDVEKVDAACNNKLDSTASTDLVVEQQAPRIKVKSAAELMSDKPLCRFMTEDSLSVPITNSSLLQAENVWPPQNGLNVYVAPQTQMNTNSNAQTFGFNVSPSHQFEPSIPVSKQDFVILNTIELPNTKTESPYNYVKNLLQLHNLLLKDPVEDLHPDFNCLVKFKVVFNQDATEQPVVLCLSLFGFSNTFCFKVKDENQMAININKLSANWQWEILQIYRGEPVITKALQNAQRVSQETHDYTNNFLCVLKSVKKVS